MKTLEICKDDYLNIQGLFHVVSTDHSRLSLTKVCYNPKLNSFLATNGHVFRIEKAYSEDLPNDVILFDKVNFLKKEKTVSSIETVLIDDKFDIPYPDFFNIIPKMEKLKEKVSEFSGFIGMGFLEMQNFYKSCPLNKLGLFVFVPVALNRGIMIYDVTLTKFYGLIMPLNIRPDHESINKDDDLYLPTFTVTEFDKARWIKAKEDDEKAH